MNTTIPHSFEGVEGIDHSHRLEEMDETEVAYFLGLACERTFGRIKEDGALTDGEEDCLTTLLESSFALHRQIAERLKVAAQAFPS